MDPSPQFVGARSDEGDDAGSRFVAKEVVGVARAVKGRASLAVVNGVSFSMGLGWKAAVMGCVDPSYILEPNNTTNDESVVLLWVVAVCAFVLIAPLILLLSKLRTKMQARVLAATKAGDVKKATMLRAREMTIDSIVNWGLTFALCVQVDNAIKNSIPSSPTSWRIVYFAMLLSFMASIAILLQCCLATDKPVIGEASTGVNLANTILAGGAYVVTLAFMSMTESLFSLTSVGTSFDITYLCVYTVATLIFATILIAAIGVADKADLSKTVATLMDNTNKTTTGFKCGCCSVGGRALRKLLSRVAAMSAVVAIYTTMYVALAKQFISNDAIYNPLPVGIALALFGSILFVAVIGGLMVEKALAVVSDPLEKFDGAMIPGKIDDFVVASLHALAQTISATVVEALSWLVGCGLHALGMALWFQIVSHFDRQMNTQVVSQVNVETTYVGQVVVVIYAGIVTILAAVIATCVPPPPKS